MPPFTDQLKNQSKLNSSGWQISIDLANKVQNGLAKAGLSESFDFPQIAAVGAQSAGKSSVIESLVGRDFLPRGEGLVTRCPIELNLRQDIEEYVIFCYKDSKENKKFTDYGKVREMILAETQRLSPGENQIFDTPITLEIHSPHVLNLKLIDLPGMVKNPLPGQPADIEEQIRRLILTYIEKDSCLILALTPANQDLAISEALKIAKEVDPEGNRTIGVITKLDEIAEGTDVRKILENRDKIRLKRGFIGVVNRSPKDIQENKDISHSRQREKEFFAKNSAYQDLRDKQGTSYLLHTLNQQLMQNIRDRLPQLCTQLLELQADVEQKAEKFLNQSTEDVDGTQLERIRNGILSKFLDDLVAEINGATADYVSSKKLGRGVYIKKILHQEIPRRIMKPDTTTEEMRIRIQTVIENRAGIYLAHFIPDMAFRQIAQEEIETMRNPALFCVNLVVNEVSRAIKEVADQINTYPYLRRKIQEIASIKLKEYRTYAREQISFLFECEKSYMNTHHKDFPMNRGLDERDPTMLIRNLGMPTVRGKSSFTFEPIQNPFEPEPLADESDEAIEVSNEVLVVNGDTIEMRKILELLDGYLPIVVDRMRDLVLRCTTFVVIDKLIAYLKAELPILLGRLDNKSLMQESETEMEMREKTLAERKAINEALADMMKLDVLPTKSLNETVNHPIEESHPIIKKSEEKTHSFRGESEGIFDF